MDIPWMEWGPEAFNRAQSEDKLILLDITASWCHWCHEMDRNTYSDEGVAERVEENFIPVRVDTDKRPDVNARYNMGGWPSTVILTSEGDLVTGATYIPPSQMKQFLDRVVQLYEEDRDVIEEEAHTSVKKDLPEGETGSHLIETYRSLLESRYDEKEGGFGYEPKFPQPEIYGLVYALAGEGQGWKDRIQLTLHKMLNGELFDREEGGFFRYCTTRDWRDPHYEKLLKDNAGLLQVYLRGYLELGKDDFKRAAEKTVDYLTTTLYDEEGYFYGSQDADEEYYTADDREGMEPPEIDEKMYADGNGRTVSALLDASVTLDEPEYREMALDVLENVTEECFDGSVVYHFAPWGDRTPATLSDSTAVLEACIDAYQHTLDEEWIFKATDIADGMIATFGSDGAFYDIASTEDHGFMEERIKDPEDNGAACRALLRLAVLTEEDRYRTVAEEALEDLAGLIEEEETFAPQYGEALFYNENGLVEVTITDEEFHRPALSTLSRRVVVRETGENTVCIEQTCHKFSNESELLEHLEEVTG